MKNQFDIDVTLNGGYLYSETGKLSSQMANERLTKAVFDTVSLAGKVVLDVGCGDGAYTYRYLTKSKPKQIIGFDISNEAIKAAQKKYTGIKNVVFYSGDIYNLEQKHTKADIAIVRGVLHHVSDPSAAIQAVSKMADEILIIEPNGYNPILKVIEKISPYHRAHAEKSYFPFSLRKMMRNAGYKKDISWSYINLVPFFFPELPARFFKKLEPFIEKIPFLSRIACGVFVVHAKK